MTFSRSCLLNAIPDEFAGIFSAPHYKKQDNLILLLSGVMVADFLGGVGVSLVNFEFAGTFVVFGYTDAS